MQVRYPLGFPLVAGLRYERRSKRFLLQAEDVRALEMLIEMARFEPAPGDFGWMLEFREQIRQIERIDPRAALSLVIDLTPHQRIRCLAIWLRGRCGGKLGTLSVEPFLYSQDRTMRKEAVRCLKRLGAWSQLREIEAADPDPRIRRLARQSAPRSHHSRWVRFARNVDSRPARNPRRSLFVSPQVGRGGGCPPKQPSRMRQILKRIHLLVSKASRGGARRR